MSSTVTIKQSKGVRVVGLLTLIAGIVLILAGGVTWWAVADKLSQEGITVSEDADFLAGRHVNDPFTAFAQAEVINEHALAISDGLTYAELPQDDPRRETVMNASFLRASLFTSVVSFGVAALVIGLGVLFILVGWALRRLASGPPVVVADSGVHGAHALSSDAPVTSAPTSAPRRPDEPTHMAGSAAAAPVTPGSAAQPAVTDAAANQPGASPSVASDATTPTTPAPPADERPTGWATPADRVPPPTGTPPAGTQAEGTQPDGTRDEDGTTR